MIVYLPVPNGTEISPVSGFPRGSSLVGRARSKDQKGCRDDLWVGSN